MLISCGVWCFVWLENLKENGVVVLVWGVVEVEWVGYGFL